MRSADRTTPEQPRQQSKRADQRPAALPWLDLYRGARMAVDLPCQIIDAAGIGEAGLGEADDGQPFAAPLQHPPAGSRLIRLRRWRQALGQRGVPDGAIA